MDKPQVLFLDDDDTRWETFIRNLPPGHWGIRARTASEAIGLLATEQFGTAFLDHDLPDINIGTGLNVAMFIAMCPHRFSNMKVIIHSRNYYGNTSIKLVLPNAVQWAGVWEFPDELKRLCS